MVTLIEKIKKIYPSLHKNALKKYIRLGFFSINGKRVFDYDILVEEKDKIEKISRQKICAFCNEDATKVIVVDIDIPGIGICDKEECKHQYHFMMFSGKDCTYLGEKKYKKKKEKVN